MQENFFNENQAYGGDFHENQVYDDQMSYTEVLQGGVPATQMPHLPCGALQEAHQYPLQAASNEPVNWNVAPHSDFITEGLPPGLSLDPQTGIIVGIPTESGYYNFTVRASNVHGYATQAMSMQVLSEDEENPTPRYYQLSFDLGGWDDIYPSYIDPIRVLEGTNIFPIINQVWGLINREGYTLSGWSRPGGFGTGSLVMPNDVMPPNDLTVSALWSKHVYLDPVY